MIVTEKEAHKLYCPMGVGEPVDFSLCAGSKCMAFTYADTRDGEDRYYCGMAACPNPRTNSGETL
jgi:hypothetical protein